MSTDTGLILQASAAAVIVAAAITLAIRQLWTDRRLLRGRRNCRVVGIRTREPLP